MLVMAAGLAALVYGEGSARLPMQGEAIRTKGRLTFLLHALPLLVYILSMAINWSAGDGSLARYPVAAAAAIFYAILIIATRRFTLSLAPSLGIIILASLPAPLL